MGLRSRAGKWVPRFWRGEAGPAGDLLALALVPAELGFRLGIAARGKLYRSGMLGTQAAPIPVISVGNLTVGGTGKTPISAWVAGRLRVWGRKPAIVLSGYGADEILVHRELNPSTPVFAAPSRLDGIHAAAKGECDCAILDDGFQHRRVSRDLDIVLIAAERWREPRRMLPRGPWREPVSALQRADFVLITRKTASAKEATRIADELEAMVGVGAIGVVDIAPTGLLRLNAEDAESQRLLPLDSLRNRQVLAVTSIADPGSFVGHLRASASDVDLLEFPDHHEFTAHDRALIRTRGRGRAVVVTRKDAVKLRAHEMPGEVYLLEQEVRVEQGEAELENALRGAIEAKG